MALKQRIVVVGLGSIGRRHARLLAKRGDLAVELCESSPQALVAATQELGAMPTHASFDAMLATRPPFVLVATPHALHADQAVAALKAGAHVLCEKPMADTLANAHRMIDAAAKTDRVLSTAFMLHFHPGLRRVRELIRAGELGRVLHVHARVGSYITLVNSKSRYQATLPGALMMDYAHQPDLFHWWLGAAPRRVSAVGVQAGEFEFTSNPNVLTVTLNYDPPMIATIHFNYAQMPQRHEYEIVGDRAWVVFDLDAGVMRIGRRATQAVTEQRFSTERDPVYESEHEAFFAAAAGRRPVESPPADAIVSMRIVDAAVRSWSEDRVAELGE